MKYSVTGTPGVGKTSACALVKGIPVHSVDELATRFGALGRYDRKRRTRELDTIRLARAVSRLRGDMIIEGHLSHLLRPDVAIVLRCSPKVLEHRLRKAGWPESKVRENVEAEAVDVILIEALAKVRVVCEIDVTRKRPATVARAIESIVAGERQKYRPGHVDWSREVLSWF